jgi:hypothetical protein
VSWANSSYLSILLDELNGKIFNLENDQIPIKKDIAMIGTL